MLRLRALNDETGSNEIEGREEYGRDDVGEDGTEEERHRSWRVDEEEIGEVVVGGGPDDGGERCE